MGREKFYEGWIELSKKEIFARGFILLSTTLFLASLVFQVVEMFASKGTLSGLDIALYIISWILILLLVVSNVSFYLDEGRMKKYALTISIILFAYNALSIVLYAADFIKDTAYFVFGCAFVVGLLLNIICIIYMKKQSIDI